MVFVLLLTIPSCILALVAGNLANSPPCPLVYSICYD